MELKQPIHNIDFTLLGVVIILVLIGLVMVYDASVVHAFKDFGDKYYYIKQQVTWAILGLACLSFFAFFNYQILHKLSTYLLIISSALLLAVFIPGLGITAGGAHRWLKIGFFTLQPTEIIKIASIIFFSAKFASGVKTPLFIIVVSFVVFVLSILQKDMGSTIVFFLTGASLYLVAGARIIYFLIFIPSIIASLMYFILKSEYRKQRILAFLDPFSDPQGFTYHISQVLIALGSGSWFGLGLGQSRQKFEYIPEVSTDSIFAIVGEEFGFIGGLVLILILSFLTYRGFKIAENTKQGFGKLLAFGLSVWIGIQAAINLAAMVSLVPLTGVPLPFISYGGSALLTNLIAVGILLNISRNTKVDK